MQNKRQCKISDTPSRSQVVDYQNYIKNINAKMYNSGGAGSQHICVSYFAPPLSELERCIRSNLVESEASDDSNNFSRTVH